MLNQIFIHTRVKVDRTHVLLYVRPVLTYLLGTISRLAMYFDHGVLEMLGNHQRSIVNLVAFCLILARPQGRKLLKNAGLLGGWAPRYRKLGWPFAYFQGQWGPRRVGWWVRIVGTYSFKLKNWLHSCMVFFWQLFLALARSFDWGSKPWHWHHACQWRPMPETCGWTKLEFHVKPK